MAAGEASAGVQERADRVEAIRGYQSPGNAVPQALLDLRGQTTGDGLKLGVEQRTSRTEGVEHLVSGPGSGLCGLSAASMGLKEPLEILPEHERDRCAPRGGLASPGDVVLFSPGTSSFDMFKSYADRGDQFRKLVQTLPR